MSTAKHITIRGLVALTALAIVGVPSVRADKVLSWKFKAGDKFTYAMAEVSNTLVDFNGIEIDIESSRILDIAWEVQSTSADGSAEVSQTVTRFQVKISSPFTGEMVFDSAAKTEEGDEEEGANDRIKQMLGPMIKGLINQQIVAKINPNGEVTEVTLPEVLTEALAEGKNGDKEGGRGGRGGGMMGMLFGGSLDEDGLKKMVAESVALLSADAVKEGSTWKKQVTASMGPAAMVTDVVYTYAGTEDRDGTVLDKITLASNTTIELPDDAEVDAEFEISEQDDTGTIYFDSAAGRTVQAINVQKMTIEGETEMGDVYLERETTATIILGTSDDLPKSTGDGDDESDDGEEGDGEEG